MPDVPDGSESGRPQPPGRPIKGPFVEVCPPGKHAWCRCRRSGTYPRCDGTHRGSTESPLKVTFDQTRTVIWCACGHTGNPPFCDGTHSSI